MQKAIIKLGLMLSIIVISVILFLISKALDFKKRRYIKNGYGCLEPSFKVMYITSAVFFFCAYFFGLIYSLAWQDGYMQEHPDVSILVISFIVLFSVGGILFIHITRSMRVFYNKENIVILHAFKSETRLNPYEISRIVVVITSYSSALTIETIDHGKIKTINSTYIGFEEFLNFAKLNLASKMEFDDKTKKRSKK